MKILAKYDNDVNDTSTDITILVQKLRVVNGSADLTINHYNNEYYKLLIN